MNRYSEEVWKLVKGYEELYEVSNIGNVRRIKYENAGNRSTYKLPYYLKPMENYLGYKYVGLSNKGKVKFKMIHQLVIESFVGERPKGMVVNHINSNNQDNRVSNLEYCTQKENIKNAILSGRFTNKPILQYDLNCNMLKEWNSSKEIQNEIGFSQASIYRACNDKNNNEFKGYMWKYKGDVVYE